jgi:hypothetical protein
MLPVDFRDRLDELALPGELRRALGKSDMQKSLKLVSWRNPICRRNSLKPESRARDRG